MRRPFPLQWPEGWKRTSSRGTPKFMSDFTNDRDAVIRRLYRRGTNVVITSDLPVGNKGLPYMAPVNDPGIAVYWSEVVANKPVERVIAIDRWRNPGFNMRAIAKSLDALDGIKRWGADALVERSFGAFNALPPGSSGTMPAVVVARPWREVLGGMWPEGLGNVENLLIAKTRHRALILEHHPDRGGNAEIAVELNAAMAGAEAELA